MLEKFLKHFEQIFKIFESNFEKKKQKYKNVLKKLQGNFRIILQTLKKKLWKNWEKFDKILGKFGEI